MRTATQLRLQQVMRERNLKQRDILEMSLPYQKKFGIKMGKSALSQYVNGKSAPDQHKLYLLGATLGLNEAWLMGFDVPMDRVPDDKRGLSESTDISNIYEKLEQPRQQKVYSFAEKQLEEQNNNIVEFPKNLPIVGKSAANPSVIEYGDVDIEVGSFAHIPNGADCAIVIQGDSMEPLIKDGEIIFYKKQPDIENGEIAIVEINGDGVTCKKVYFNIEEQTIILRSLNDKYTDREVNDDEIRIIGKVILN
ncbi:helix-turn-helix transcriptional regulator [Carnobacterium divergens]|uniref:S24 family peptidase n=1 Tax=Carnobacterium divergens TaxID=2748 RepID=UPI001EE9205F|nr:S24 family peptidase [Carnobacterium divergens]